MTGQIDAIVVVVPVRNEQELLSACIASIADACEQLLRARPTMHVSSVFVLDRCTDDSALIADALGATTMSGDFGNVGSARNAGIELLLVPHGDLSAVWIANTDADSTVPPNWLLNQLSRAESGTDLVVGTVRPPDGDLSQSQHRAWAAGRVRGRPNGHVHGANLGIRASEWRAAGGFPSIEQHEDVRLVERAVVAGAVLEASDAGEVVTSGRREGRTPGGYAGYLRHAFPEVAESEDALRSVGIL